MSRGLALAPSLTAVALGAGAALGPGHFPEADSLCASHEAPCCCQALSLSGGLQLPPCSPSLTVGDWLGEGARASYGPGKLVLHPIINLAETVYFPWKLTLHGHHGGDDSKS